MSRPAWGARPSGHACLTEYQTRGAVLLRGVFTDWIPMLQHGVAELMANPSKLERSYQPEGSAKFFQDLCNWQRIPAFRDFIFHAPAGEIAAALMDAREVRFFHDHVLVKEPGTTLATPWHQDAPYYCVTAPKNVSFWIPLDPVPAATSLHCLAGSHDGAVIHKPKRFDGTDLYPGDTRAEMPHIDPMNEQVLAWALEPGDAVAFHFATVHGAAATTHATTRRRVFSARFVGEGAVFADRGGRGSPPFRHVTLRDGDPLAGEDFPLVWKNTGEQ